MPRTYTEREIAALLARAAERQRASVPDDGAPGLSLDEVARAAAEAGLDPAHVRAAAAEIDAGALPLARPDPRPGAVDLERWVDAPLTDAAWEEAVHLLRARFGPSAETGLAPAGPDVTRVGGASEWTHQTFGGLRTVVSASPRGGQTRLRLTQTEWGAVGARATAALVAALASLVLALAAALAVAGQEAGPLALVLAPLLVFAAGTAAGTAWGTPAVQRHRGRRRARLAAALADVAVTVEATHAAFPSERTAGAAPVAQDAARLDASLLDAPDAPDSAEGARARRRAGA